MHKAKLCAPLLLLFLLTAAVAQAEEPPAINPFGEKPTVREDALPGYVELSDGSIHPGRLYLTRDKLLQINDEQAQRQREVPLSAVTQIDCAVKREWMEQEWRFKEAGNDEKVFTGRVYPAREYIHTITLRDKRTISGGLSGIVYLQPLEYSPGVVREDQARLPPQRYVLNKRQKGKIGEALKSLVYVKLIRLGNEDYEEGLKKAKKRESEKGS
jgi:hypothetical protein